MRTILNVWMVLMIAGTAAAEAWNIPDPSTTEHVGAQEAPASSPATYPDTAGFDTRTDLVVRGLAEGGLDRWRKGYFAGGDPGKYLPGHAMAKLLINPDDPEPAKYMNDNRSYKEHYHFACVNWARFYPIFGDKVLTEETKEKFAKAGFTHGSYHNHAGTENHKTMWWTSAAVLPQFTGQGLSRKSKEASLKTAKETLRSYVRNLLHYGAGEWDSSTYLMFTANGLMNIYDFSDDPEMRLLAKAGLDCMITSYALKYTDGIFTAPNQRGFAGGPYQTIADQTGYLWWGGNKKLTSEDTRGFRYTLHPTTSSYRPNRVMTNLATKNLPKLPTEFRNRRANYWHGQSIPAKHGARESLYIDELFTMGTLWDGYASQHARFQLVVSTPEGGVQMTMGHPRKTDHTGKKIGLGYRDGTSRYAQFAQAGSTTIMLAQIPENEEADFVYFTLPDGVEEFRNVSGMTGFVVGDVLVRLIPLGGEMRVVAGEGKGKKRVPTTVRVAGRQVGLIVEAINMGDIQGFIAEAKAPLNTENGGMLVTYTDWHGRAISMTFNPDPAGDDHGNRMAKVTVDGKPVEWRDGAVINGQYVQQVNGVMTVNDGKEGFIIDFTGDLPVYKAWKP